MASGPYSFIDIAVMEEVRTRFAAGDALAILTIDLDEVIWANGPGAALLGYPDIEAVMGGSPGLGFAARRQIAATPGFPRLDRDRPVMVRLASGMTSRAVQFLVTGITLPDGEPAVLLAVPAQAPRSLGGEEAAARIIEGFGEAGYFAALLDDEAHACATSPGFETLGISRETLTRLVAEVAHESDRLVKRLIPTGDGLIPAGIARLADDPALHLLVAVDEPIEEIAQEPAPEANGSTATPGAAAISTPADDETAPAPSDADLPERIVEDTDEAAADVQKPAASDTADNWYFDEPPPQERPELPTGPVRFVWRTDADGAFSAVSDDFARAVGKEAADVIGRRFDDVAAAFQLDPGGEIAGLLQRRDTWSGRSVLWPVAGTDLRAPVDLAALPVYNRDRDFEGFRGFGVVRMGDLAADPEALGLKLVAGKAPPAKQAPAAEEENKPEETAPTPVEDDPFNGEVPAIALTDRPERRASDKVVRLAEHRPVRAPEKQLSPGERNAFEEIRARLRRDYEETRQAERAAAEELARKLAAETSPTPETAAPPQEDGQKPLEARAGISTDDRATGADDTAKDDANAADAAANDDREVEEEFFDEPHMTALDADDEDPTDAVSAEPVPDKGAVKNLRGIGGDVSSDEAAAEENAPLEDDTADDGVTAVEPATAPAAETTMRPAPPIAADGFTPSAFVSGEPSHETGIDADLIAGLPFPLLVHAGDELYFANREFLNLTGYASLDQIRREGGLDRLFVDKGPDAAAGPDGSKLRLRTLGGEEFPVDAHLQSIRWRAGSALLLALRRLDVPRPGPVSTPVRVAATAESGEVEEMERRVAEMRTIIDTATDGVVLIAADGTIRNISRPAEALFGFDSAEVEGKPFASLFAIESQRAARDYLAGLAENGVASVLNDGREVIGREAEGRFIPLFMTIGRLPGDSGYCAVVRDITQWKRAEEELTQARTQAERASSQKTEFLARVSHEIRTPLNAIIGFSELMIDEKFGPIGSDRYRDYLRDINRSGNHVLDLVNDLLDISKIEAGEQEMNYEAVSLNDTLGESVAVMQPQANRDRVIIRSSFASRLPEVVADLRSVRQIAFNLLSNAIRYTQAGGQVIVSTSYEPSGDVVMRVRDTGIGMTLSEIDQALKPFKQINALKRGRHDGTGLGLPLTKAMVEANRARFSISSTPGEGTMVEITFPSTRVLAD